MKYFIVIILLFFIHSSHAQNNSYKLYMGLHPTYGFAWAHSKELSAIENTQVLGCSFDISKYHYDADAVKWNSKGYYNGFQFSYSHFTNSILGDAISAAYFLEPILYKNNKMSVSVRGSIGAIFTSHPYDSVNNPLNLNYSIYLNPFLSLCICFNYHINNDYFIQAKLNYNHFSNGNIQDPNYGLNFPTAIIGIDKRIKNISHHQTTVDERKYWRFDVIPFFSNKSSTLALNDRFWVYGIGITASKKISLLHAYTLGAEWMADESVKLLYASENRLGRSYNRAGIMVGHEFLFGNKFVFSQQLGLYIFNQTPYVSWIYHRWGLNYRLTKNIMLGANLLADLQKANFLDARLIYCIYK